MSGERKQSDENFPFRQSPFYEDHRKRLDAVGCDLAALQHREILRIEVEPGDVHRSAVQYFLPGYFDGTRMGVKVEGVVVALREPQDLNLIQLEAL